MISIYPSLISADLLHLKKVIKELEPYCAGYHIDIMDNHFVPNLTWGSAFVDAIAQATVRPLWMHLMVDNPLSWVHTLTLPEQSIVSFHWEAVIESADIEHIISLIKHKRGRASIALNPVTPVQVLYPFLESIDHVLIMSVHPGASGQSYLPETDIKIRELVDHCAHQALSVTIGIDGGLTYDHCVRLSQRGVSHFAAAAAIFHTSDPVEALKELHKI